MCCFFFDERIHFQFVHELVQFQWINAGTEVQIEGLRPIRRRGRESAASARSPFRNRPLTTRFSELPEARRRLSISIAISGSIVSVVRTAAS